MGPRPNAISPIKCTASSRRTKRPCGRYAVPGAVVCKLHGAGAPQVREKANMRLSLAELMQSNPRSFEEVVRDHLHTMDALAREARSALGEGMTPTADQIDRVDQTTRGAIAAAKLVHGMGVHESMKTQAQVDVEATGQVVSEVLGRLIDFWVNSENMPIFQVREKREWMFECVHLMLGCVNCGASMSEVVLPDPPTFEEPTSHRAQLALPTAQTSTTADETASRSRQPASDSSFPEDVSDPAGDALASDAPTVQVVEPLEGELLVDNEDEPPTPTPRTGWSPSGMPNAWRQGSEFTRPIG